ncbi:MAG: type III secretion system chaperone [Victivallales bacterium]|nr:type III secretion system chaperone [Victivallales bacterium]
MMPLPDSFNASLAEFGKTLGIELMLEDGRCNFIVDDTIEVELDYIEDAHVVVAWATVGLAIEDNYQGERARALLALNELDAPNGGFSISMDPEMRRVIVHDHRPAELFDSADRIAVWIGALVDLVYHIRNDFEKRFPCADIPFDDEIEEEA